MSLRCCGPSPACLYEDNCNPYDWTFKEILMSEILLNILTSPPRGAFLELEGQQIFQLPM
jgi:hypothetical protein